MIVTKDEAWDDAGVFGKYSALVRFTFTLKLIYIKHIRSVNDGNRELYHDAASGYR